MSILISRIFLGSFMLLSPAPHHAEPRAWSNREGKVLQAEFVSYNPVTKKVTLKRLRRNSSPASGASSSVDLKLPKPQTRPGANQGLMGSQRYMLLADCVGDTRLALPSKWTTAALPLLR